jgi:hypothetical protein
MLKSSEDILKQIQAEIDRRGELPGSLEELNKIASEVVHKFNNAEVPDFEGLSPHRMSLIMNKPFSDESPIKFNPSVNPALLTSLPVIRVCSLIMETIRAENGLKLTPKGNLPRKIVSEIFGLNLFTKTNSKHLLTKALNEDDFVPAAYTRALMKLAGLVMIRKNKLLLTKAGMGSYDPVLLFHKLFIKYETDFHKGYLDGYESGSIGNIGGPYVIYLLHLYGHEQREASFYASLYFKAFPDLIRSIPPSPYTEQEKMAYGCYIYRTFDKGLFLFGLVDIEYKGGNYSDRKMYIKTTEAFHQVFKIE